MTLSEPIAQSITDALRDLARELDGASHGEKGALKEKFRKLHGWSAGKLHRELRRIGWSSGRKRRVDAGSTSQEETGILHIGAALGLGVRKNGKATMEVPNARSLLAANGRRFTVSNSRIRTLLKQRRLDARTQREPAPHTNMRSLHPNHVHLLDPSLCLLFYTPDGKQHLIRDDEAYKNKPEYIERVGELKLWRYVLVDHYSSTVIHRYYQAKGENQANLFEFLLHCWGRCDRRPFHGVPSLLVWDKGSANTASAVRNALRALEVDTYAHKAGNPRAKGGVEQANNLVEKLFESRLRYEPVDSVAALNTAAAAWCNAYNADALPEYDARLRRPGMTRKLARFALWQMIRPEQLRLLPDVDVCRYLLSAEPKPRKVRPDMTIQFAHPVSKRSERYDLRGIPNLFPRAEVLVSPLIYGDHEVVVIVEDYRGDTQEHIVQPIPYDSLSGMRLDAPVWGEDWDRQPDTVADQAGKAADQAAYPNLDQQAIEKAKDKNLPPFGGLDAHTHLGELYLPDYMDRRGTELHVPDRTRVELRPLTHVEACRALVGLLGHSLPEGVYDWIRKTYPEGVPEEQISVLTERFTREPAPQVGLKVIK